MTRTDVTEDQIYLMDRLNDNAERSHLTPAAIQRFNKVYGTVRVTDALRYMRGFVAGCEAPYAYLDKVLRSLP